MGAMLGLVLADNMVALFAFWELTSVASFLLIGFDHTRQAARRAAIQALVVTGIGGLALLAGAVILRLTSGTWSLSALGRSSPRLQLYPIVLVAVLLAAFTKSAQVPFHFWLPNAMEAPTPVSAYLHSATMVQAGVYLLARMNPMLGGTAAWTMTLCVFGGVTLLWGALAALRQTDLKQMLAQTTVASLGLSVLLIGDRHRRRARRRGRLFRRPRALQGGAVPRRRPHRQRDRRARHHALGGLRERMAVTFIAAVFAGVSMSACRRRSAISPRTRCTSASSAATCSDIVLLVVMVLGNAVLGAVALALMIKPFMGPAVATPKAPQRGAVRHAAGAGAPRRCWDRRRLADRLAVRLPWPRRLASAVRGTAIESHLDFSLDPLNPILWLSVATWAAGGGDLLAARPLRGVAAPHSDCVGLDLRSGFDAVMFGLIRFAGAADARSSITAGSSSISSSSSPCCSSRWWCRSGWSAALPALPDAPSLTFYEWGVVLLGGDRHRRGRLRAHPALRDRRARRAGPRGRAASSCCSARRT